MPPKSPINHDSLFKWLIYTFHLEFFAHYFPNRRLGEVNFIDKEFLSKYEGLKDSKQGDLLLCMEVELDGEMHNIVVCIEHKSWRANPGEQVMEYAVQAWLLKRQPVWSIVVFTDDAQWNKDVPDAYWLGYCEREGKQFHAYDIIKVNREKSSKLIAERSLFCRLMALKADASGLDRAEIVQSIYQHAQEMGDRLTKEHKLLIHHFIEAYAHVPKKVVEKIREKNNMAYPASSISEYYMLLGEERGEERGEKRGEERGEKRGEQRGELKFLNEMYRRGCIGKDEYQKRSTQIQQVIDQLNAESDASKKK